MSFKLLVLYFSSDGKFLSTIAGGRQRFLTVADQVGNYSKHASKKMEPILIVFTLSEATWSVW